MTAAIMLMASTAHAQQTVSEIVLFLLTNRSVATDDFVRDADAALATYESLSRFLSVELGTLPIGLIARYSGLFCPGAAHMLAGAISTGSDLA